MIHTNLVDVCTKSEYIFHSIPDKKLTESEMLILSDLWPLVLFTLARPNFSPN